MTIKPRRYSRNTSGCQPIASHIHADVATELRAFTARHQLTQSGAIHHLLRIALGLQPLQDLDNGH